MYILITYDVNTEDAAADIVYTKLQDYAKTMVIAYRILFLSVCLQRFNCAS